ncbi:hypothetical protein TNCV_164151 [Trichonephila clavipes]|nr:hypothetical protein TNCV_164151 [Trichonephila clavipes]
MSLIPLKTRRVGERCTLNLSRLKCVPVGVVRMLGKGTWSNMYLTMVQNEEIRLAELCVVNIHSLDKLEVLSSSLDRGSKLRGQSPIASCCYIVGG